MIVVAGIAVLYLSYRALLLAISWIAGDTPKRKAFASSGALLFLVFLPTAVVVNKSLLPSLLSPQSLLGNFILVLAFSGLAILVGLLLSTSRHARLLSALEVLLKPFAVRVLLAGLSLVLLLNIAVYAYARTGQPATANLLMISVDTLRRDALSCYESPNSTPHFDRLAARGVRFQNAYAQMSVTLPSHAAFFTGRYPGSLGLLQNRQVVPSSATALPEVLRDSGYSTAAFVSASVLYSCFGTSQGFQLYKDGLGPISRGGGRSAHAATNDALKWIDGHRERPFCVWIHYFSPHFPYLPPGRFLDKAFMESETDTLVLARARYDGEVKFVDEQLGRLIDSLDSLGLSSKTMIVLFSDHGEGLGDHNYMGHQAHIYEEQVRVPMIMVYPEVLPDHSVYEDLAQSIDVFPTVLDALQLRFNGKAPQGRSLLSALTSKAGSAANEYSFGQRRRFLTETPLSGVDGSSLPQPDRMFYIRSLSHKLIWSDDTIELYDLISDPRELVNIAGGDPETAAELTGLLEAWVEATALESEPLARFADEETRDRLRSLGYID
jgi:arylsulfatase A-like enzyme